jgi:hypothetical protein
MPFLLLLFFAGMINALLSPSTLHMQATSFMRKKKIKGKHLQAHGYSRTYCKLARLDTFSKIVESRPLL